MSTDDQFDKLVNALKQQRDELKLKLKLGSAEVKEQWEELEHKLDKLTNKADRAGIIAEHTGEQLIEATKLAADEIRKGYERIRKML